MVDNFGIWTLEEDYSLYPKEKWCDMDYVANYINEQGYVPKTSMASLIEMVLLHFTGEVEDNDMFAPMYRQNNMINISNLSAFVEASGGFKEFDYEV